MRSVCAVTPLLTIDGHETAAMVTVTRMRPSIASRLSARPVVVVDNGASPGPPCSAIHPLRMATVAGTKGAAVVRWPKGASESPSALCGSKRDPLAAMEDGAVPASFELDVCARAQHQPPQG